MFTPNQRRLVWDLVQCMTKARKDIQKLRSGGVIIESAHVYKNGAPIIRVENEKEFGQEIGMDSGIEIMEAAR